MYIDKSRADALRRVTGLKSCVTSQKLNPNPQYCHEDTKNKLGKLENGKIDKLGRGTISLFCYLFISLRFGESKNGTVEQFIRSH